MHLQLTHDSTNFEVPFLWNNTSIKVDSANPKTIGIDTEFKKLQEKSAKPQKIAQNLQQTDLLDVVVNDNDSIAIVLPFTREPVPIDYLKLDSLTTFLKFNTSHKPKVYFTGEKRNEEEYDSWQWIFILLAIALIGATRAFNHKRFLEYINAIFSRNASAQIIRNEKVYGNRAHLFLTGAYFLIAGLMGLQIAEFIIPIPELKQLTYYIIAVIILITSYLFKILLHKILAAILSFEAMVDEYIFAISLYNVATLFLLLPNILILSYGPSEFKSLILSISAIMIGFGISARIFRGLQIGINSQANIIYLFLYLCTLEILPLIIVFKILFN